MTTPFLTDPSNATISPNGCTQLPSGLWVTRVPLVDTAARPLFAHLHFKGAHQVARRYERFGGRVIRPPTIVEVHRFGQQIKPYPLPDAEQIAEFRKLHGPRPRDPDAGLAWDRLLYLPMSGREWCERHDFEVWNRIARSDWDLLKAISGAGKLWTDDGNAGNWSQLLGGPRHATSSSLLPNKLGGEKDWLQPLMTAHRGGLHHDYMTLTMLEFDQEPTDDVFV